MNRTWMAAILVCGLLAGCDQVNRQQGRLASPQQPAAAVGGVLPRNLASGPETINIPRRFQQLRTFRALAAGPDVHIYSREPWRGHEVTVYYIPGQNIAVDSDRYYLRTTANVQRIGHATIRTDGSWTLTWHVGHEWVVPKRVFLLARSDDGELSLAQVQHFQNHLY